ncbi:facilitated trehalose transporter Tret1-like [Cylas formicarius]|uniref:facilitated trehalose transporter Tret1-like n=1 Tax=Cylas formicarius TaxID=197179 RepID=UPI002958B266|nr:facilitated trehalose transporter Tret1-like [Cylas formicarius]
MVDYSVVSVLTGYAVVFIACASMSWPSPEIPALNSSTSQLDSELTTEEISWIASFLGLGAIPGPFIFGFLADHVGRKYSILSLSVPLTLSYLLMLFTNKVIYLYIARFVVGTAVGGVFTVLPMYVGEMALDRHRGILGNAMTTFLCLGLLFSYAVGPYLNFFDFNVMLAALPAVFLVVFAVVGVESAHYYMAKNDRASARAVLLKIRNVSDQEVEEELENIRHLTDSERGGKLSDIFKSRGLARALFMTLGVMVFQQLAGIDPLTAYSEQIFDEANTSIPAEICAIMIGLVQFVASFITPAVANRFGRKTLLIFSAVGMAVSEATLGLYFIFKNRSVDVSSVSFSPVLSLVAYYVFFNCGFGSIPFTIVGEIFPNNVKSSAAAVNTSLRWLVGFLMTRFFRNLVDLIEVGWVFELYGLMCVLAAFFIGFVVAETKGKSLKEIQDHLNN